VLLADLKRDFATVKHVKPAASRPDSAELYVLATGFRGAATGSRRGYLTGCDLHPALFFLHFCLTAVCSAQTVHDIQTAVAQWP